MQPAQITLLTFSPAGHTKTALWAVANAWKPIAIRTVDLSNPHQKLPGTPFSEQELCILGVPSYGGRIPALATQRMKQLTGNNTPLVNLVSYGNRHFDDTLAEMQDIMDAQGFRTIAGITAIAEHTICPQYATGRPNLQDQSQLTDFGRQIRDKLTADGPCPASMPGNRPYRTFGGIPVKPYPTDRCTHCGTCAGICPAQAIQPPEFTADPQRCFTCMRCVYACPEHARELPLPFVQAVAAKLAPACTQDHPNQLFL